MSYHRPLFYSAAAFNVGAALPFLLAPGRIAPVMGLELNASARLLLQLLALTIAIYGGAYALVARDPVRFRPYVPLGAILKLVVVAMFWGYFLAGSIGPGLPLLTLVDLAYATLFLHYYNRTRDVMPDGRSAAAPAPTRAQQSRGDAR